MSRARMKPAGDAREIDTTGLRVEDVVERIRTYRGQVIAAAHAIEFAPSGDRDRDRSHDRTHDRALRVIPLPDIE